MTPLIETLADVEKLRAIALSWVSTPYAPNGAVKGAGASCQMLPSEILQEYGFTGPKAPSRGTLSKAEIAPEMFRWLSEHTNHFQRVDIPEARAGDVVLLVIGFGHLALMLENNEIIHSWQSEGVHISSLCSERLKSRVFGIWRPLKNEQPE